MHLDERRSRRRDKGLEQVFQGRHPSAQPGCRAWVKGLYFEALTADRGEANLQQFDRGATRRPHPMS
jgi:hypothetical protein